jgi:SAM-dependent methyltransferase
MLAMQIRNTTRAVARTILGPRLTTRLQWEIRRKLGFVAEYRSRLRSRHGLEIGGPSAMLASDGGIPIYDVLSSLDNCLYAGSTIWTGEVREGNTFTYESSKEPGTQIICDSTDLHPIEASSYDCVLACHCLEHIANPLRALAEWKRVLNDEGLLLLILPHKDGTFDWRRPITPLDHMVKDYADGVGEEDLTHLPEILELHDLSRDLAAGTKDEFRQRCLANHTNRAMHHHVFDTITALETVSHIGFKILRVDYLQPLHIIILASRTNQPINNRRFLEPGSTRRSPFPSDHQRRQRTMQ